MSDKTPTPRHDKECEMLGGFHRCECEHRAKPQTPKTDALGLAHWGSMESKELCRTLERENAELREKLKQWESTSTCLTEGMTIDLLDKIHRGQIASQHLWIAKLRGLAQQTERERDEAWEQESQRRIEYDKLFDEAEEIRKETRKKAAEYAREFRGVRELARRLNEEANELHEITGELAKELLAWENCINKTETGQAALRRWEELSK